MSEAELHLIKQRMEQGTLQKARRGARRFALPIGSVWERSGTIALAPDEQVHHVVRLIFRKFDELGTLHALVRYLVQQGIEVGGAPARRPGPRDAGVALSHALDVANVTAEPDLCGGLRLWTAPS